MEILTREIKEFVTNQKLGFAATVCPDGSPNLSPKGTTSVWDDNHLVFADIHSPQTIENLVGNPSIEINIVDVFLRKGYRFKGTGEIHKEGPVFEEAVAHYKKAGAGHEIRHIVLVKVDRVLPLLSPVYDTGVSERIVRKKWKKYWLSLNR